MKKLLSVFMAIVLLVSSLGLTGVETNAGGDIADSSFDGINWNINEFGVLAVSGTYTGESDSIF